MLSSLFLSWTFHSSLPGFSFFSRSIKILFVELGGPRVSVGYGTKSQAIPNGQWSGQGVATSCRQGFLKDGSLVQGRETMAAATLEPKKRAKEAS